MPQRRTRPRFDPEGEGYFEAIAEKMRERFPAGPRPTESGRVGEGRNPNKAWDTWVFESPADGVGPPWWSPHGGSVLDVSPSTQNIDLLDPVLRHSANLMRDIFGPEVGLALKGAGHETWDKFLEGEVDLGKDIVRGPTGHYFSVLRRK